MLDLDIPPEVEEGGTDGGAHAVRRIVVVVLDVIGIANLNMAESIPLPWITVTARPCRATAPGQAGNGPALPLPTRRLIPTPYRRVKKTPIRGYLLLSMTCFSWRKSRRRRAS